MRQTRNPSAAGAGVWNADLRGSTIASENTIALRQFQAQNIAHRFRIPAHLAAAVADLAFRSGRRA
jgi:hypothetical protein